MTTDSLLGHTSEIVRIMRKSPQAADTVMSEYLRARKYVGARDRRFISGLAFHTLRILSVADAWAAHKELDDVVKAAYELCGGESTEHFALNADADWLATLPIATQVCTQEWLLDETRKRWQSDAEDVWRSMMLPAPLGIRVNLRRATRESVLASLKAEGIDCTEGKLATAAININQRINLLQHPMYENGFIEIQDEGSQLVALACNAQPDMRILDACAGAGGKALHLADIMNDGGRIVAQDIEWQRLKQVPYRSRRAGIQSIEVQTVPRDALNDNVPRDQARNDSAFDVVLVDAPCSGMGTVRRMPMPKWRLTAEQAKRHAKKQLQLLHNHSINVIAGGALVYSTCSILPIENEDVVQQFLAKHPEFTIESQQQYDAFHHGTDGLFVARLRLI